MQVRRDPVLPLWALRKLRDRTANDARKLVTAPRHHEDRTLALEADARVDSIARLNPDRRESMLFTCNGGLIELQLQEIFLRHSGGKHPQPVAIAADVYLRVFVMVDRPKSHKPIIAGPELRVTLREHSRTLAQATALRLVVAQLPPLTHLDPK